MRKKDAKIKEFLVQLSSLTSYLNHQGLSKKISIAGGQVTPQTIQNWFATLKAGDFNYFPAVTFERFGLQPYFVFFDQQPEHPYQDTCWSAYHPSSFSQHKIGYYLMPNNATPAAGGTIVKVHSPFVFYQSQHDLMPRFRQYLKHLPLQDTQVLKHEPFLLPVVMEARRPNLSSTRIWHAIKSRIGPKIWQYQKKSKRKDDQVGYKWVQKAIRTLNQDYEDMVMQIGIDYAPLTSSSLGAVLYLNANGQELEQTVSNLLEYCQQVTVYPSNEHAVIVVHTDAKGLAQLPSIRRLIKRVFYLNGTLQKNTFDYTSFDPKKNSWVAKAAA